VRPGGTTFAKRWSWRTTDDARILLRINNSRRQWLELWTAEQLLDEVMV
jgi:hypothetical protein